VYLFIVMHALALHCGRIIHLNSPYAWWPWRWPWFITATHIEPHCDTIYVCRELPPLLPPG